MPSLLLFQVDDALFVTVQRVFQPSLLLSVTFHSPLQGGDLVLQSVELFPSDKCEEKTLQRI